LGPVLFIVLSWNLYSQLKAQKDLDAQINIIARSYKSVSFYFVIFLMFLNYGIEAYKWKKLILPIEKISLKKSIKSIFAGCSITMLTPNRIGEYGGRVIYLKEGHRLKAIPVTILGSISQLLITVFIGTIGIFVVKAFPEFDFQIKSLPWLVENVLLIMSLLASILISLLYFQFTRLANKISKVKFLSFVKMYNSTLSRKELFEILFLSFLRYLVFVLQYLIMLKLMHVEIGVFPAFWLISIFFLVLAFAPTSAFIDLPLRAFAAVSLLKIYSDNIAGIQLACFGIWLINLILPAFIGSTLIFGIKIFRRND